MNIMPEYMAIGRPICIYLCPTYVHA